MEKLRHQFTTIQAFARAHGRAPSVAEIAELFGYRSKNAAAKLIARLIEHGFATRDETGRLRLPSPLETPLSFIGTMHAGKTVGFPNPAEEETAEVMTLAELLTVDLHAAKLFRVQGESMIDAGIFENDILLVECTQEWEDGDIVIAEIDGEETVKYIQTGTNGKPYLKPANETMAPLYPEEYLTVKAVVRTVIRAYGR